MRGVAKVLAVAAAIFALAMLPKEAFAQLKVMTSGGFAAPLNAALPACSGQASVPSARTRPADGVLNDLWAKALVLQDPDGRRAVLVRPQA